MRISKVAVAMTAILACPFVLSAQPTQPTAAECNDQAMAARAAGDFRGALEQARRATELDPSEPRHLLSLAVCAHDAGERKAGLAALDAYLAKVPGRASEPRIVELRRALDALPAGPATATPATPRRVTPAQALAMESLRLTLVDAAKATQADDRPQRRKHLTDALRQCRQLISDLDCVDPQVAKAGDALAVELDLEQLAFDSYVLLASLGNGAATDGEMLTVTARLRRRLSQAGQLEAAERAGAMRAEAVARRADLLSKLASLNDISSVDRNYFQNLLGRWYGRTGAYRHLVRTRLVGVLDGNRPSDARLDGAERITRSALSRSVPEDVLLDQCVITAMVTENPEDSSKALNTAANVLRQTGKLDKYAPLVLKAVSAATAIENPNAQFQRLRWTGDWYSIDSAHRAGEEAAVREMRTLAQKLVAKKGEVYTFDEEFKGRMAIAKQLSRWGDAEGARRELLLVWQAPRGESRGFDAILQGARREGTEVDRSEVLTALIDAKQPTTAFELFQSAFKDGSPAYLGLGSDELFLYAGRAGFMTVATEHASMLRRDVAVRLARIDAMAGGIAYNVIGNDYPSAQIAYLSLQREVDDLPKSSEKFQLRRAREALGRSAYGLAIAARMAGSEQDVPSYALAAARNVRPTVIGAADRQLTGEELHRWISNAAAWLACKEAIRRDDPVAALSSIKLINDEISPMDLEFFGRVLVAIRGFRDDVEGDFLRLAGGQGRADLVRQYVHFTGGPVDELQLAAMRANVHRKSEALLELSGLARSHGGRLVVDEVDVEYAAPAFAYLGDKRTVSTILGRLSDAGLRTKAKSDTDAILADDFSATILPLDDAAADDPSGWGKLFKHAAQRRWWRN